MTNLNLEHQGAIATEQDAERIGEYFAATVPMQVVIDCAHQYIKNRREANPEDWNVRVAFPYTGGAVGLYIRDSLRYITDPYCPTDEIDHRWQDTKIDMWYRRLLWISVNVAMKRYGIPLDWVPPDELVRDGIMLAYRLKSVVVALSALYPTWRHGWWLDDSDDNNKDFPGDPQVIQQVLEREADKLLLDGKPATFAYLGDVITEFKL